MTLAEIITLARLDVAEPNQAFYTNNEIMLYYNAAQKDFAKKVRPIKVEASLVISTVDNVSVTLPADFLEVDFLHLIAAAGGKPTVVPRYSGHARSRQSQLSRDFGYYILSTSPKTLKFTAEQNPPDDSVVLYYFASPAAYVDAEADVALESEIPDEHVDIVVLEVVARMKDKRREFQEGARKRAEYERQKSIAALYEKSRDGKATQNIVF